jgi:hypothetical protein
MAATGPKQIASNRQHLAVLILPAEQAGCAAAGLGIVKRLSYDCIGMIPDALMVLSSLSPAPG